MQEALFAVPVEGKRMRTWGGFAREEGRRGGGGPTATDRGRVKRLDDEQRAHAQQCTAFVSRRGKTSAHTRAARGGAGPKDRERRECSMRTGMYYGYRLSLQSTGRRRATLLAMAAQATECFLLWSVRHSVTFPTFFTTHLKGGDDGRKPARNKKQETLGQRQETDTCATGQWTVDSGQ